MVTDTYSARLGMLEMGTGNQNNSWGTSFNASVTDVIDRAIAGVNTITATGGSVDLSTVVPPAGMRADIDHFQVLTGALVSDLTITVTNVSKTWIFVNRTTGSFNVYVKVPGGVSPPALRQLPSGKYVFVTCDGAGTLYRGDAPEIGRISLNGGTSAPAGSLICNGASLLRSAFPDLFGVIGTTWGTVDGTHFTLPLLTDTNRYLRAAGGALAVGTYQSNQNLAHTHTITGAPSVGSLGTNDPGNHTHANFLTDPGHVHNACIWRFPGGSGFASGAGIQGIQDQNTPTAFTGITITNAAAGAHTHTITGAPGLGTLATATGGGSEARPESAAVLMCINY